MATNRYTEGDYFPEKPHLGYKGEVGDLRGDVERAFKRVAEDLDTNSDEQTDINAAIGSALAGDAVLVLDGALAEDISIAGDGLNTLAAGEVVKQFSLALKDSGDLVHVWANFEPLTTPAVVAVDGGIAAPAAYAEGTTDPVKFALGLLDVDVVFDTDAGSAKIYEIGDVVTVTIDVSSIPSLSSVAALVKTYNVVA